MFPTLWVYLKKVTKHNFIACIFIEAEYILWSLHGCIVFYLEGYVEWNASRFNSGWWKMFQRSWHSQLPCRTKGIYLESDDWGHIFRFNLRKERIGIWYMFLLCYLIGRSYIGGGFGSYTCCSYFFSLPFGLVVLHCQNHKFERT